MSMISREKIENFSLTLFFNGFAGEKIEFLTLKHGYFHNLYIFMQQTFNTGWLFIVLKLYGTCLVLGIGIWGGGGWGWACSLLFSVRAFLK